MSIDPQKLTNALAKLNIPAGQQVQYSKVAESLGIIPKKTRKGVETKQLLKEGSQKYKEFVYNEVLKKYELALQAEAEKSKKNKPKSKKIENKVIPLVKPAPKLLEKKLIESLKVKFYNKYRYRYENNTSLLELYNAIKENIGDGTFINIAWRDANKNIIYWRSIDVSQLHSFEEFETEVNDIAEGKFGSDPIDQNENTIDYNLFSIGSVKIAQTGKSDDIMFESKLIESKEGHCGYLSLKECGFDAITKGIKPKELRDFNKLVSVIKQNNLPIVIIANGFTINNKVEDIITKEREVQVIIKDKKRDRPNWCAELTQDDIRTVILCEPDRDEETLEYLIEPKHYLIYDEVNQHLDYIIGKPKLLSGIYLALNNKVIKNSKVIFAPKHANINNKRVEKAPIEYIFFDYETVIDFNASNCMQSYSVSVLTLDNYGLTKLEELDLLGRPKENATEEEQVKIDNARLQVSALRQANCKTFLGYDCGRQFVNWFLEYSIDKVCVFIGFNNTNFDNFLAL